MLNKQDLPSIGFVVLILTIICSAMFVKWTLSPVSYKVSYEGLSLHQKASYAEELGHQLAKDGNKKEAFKHFLIAAKITDSNENTSRRYRCAATTSSSDEEKVKYLRLALKYNPNNTNAKNGLELLVDAN